MRTIKATTVVTVLVALFATTASAQIPDVTFIDFSGWDASLIDNGPGQTFDVSPGVTVTVQGFGEFSVPTEATNATTIQSGHLFAGDRNQLFFTFNTSLDVFVKTATVDLDEQVEIIGVGAETYFNIAGDPPTLTNITSGLEIQGTGFGTNTGAAQGLTQTFAQVNQAVIVRHDSLFTNKFEFFMIGTQTVPEPNSIALLGLGAFGMILSTRKRRNR